MPVDHSHPRFGTHGTLGTASVWDCPACGGRNEGRGPEKGCILCGAGDPGKGKAGSSIESASSPQVQQRAVRPTAAPSRPVAAPVEQSVTKIYRLIEYVITRPELTQTVLRNSLVGRIEFPWGALTGTIVDTLDTTQEDRLRMARMQPGVWLGNPDAMEERRPGTLSYGAAAQQKLEYITRTVEQAREQRKGQKGQEMKNETESRERPDTGPAFSETDAALANTLVQVCGLRLIHTLALALSSIAEELSGNSEPEKFLSREECLALANALMQEIPAEWQGETQGDAIIDEDSPL